MEESAIEDEASFAKENPRALEIELTKADVNFIAPVLRNSETVSRNSPQTRDDGRNKTLQLSPTCEEDEEESDEVKRVSPSSAQMSVSQRESSSGLLSGEEFSPR